MGCRTTWNGNWRKKSARVFRWRCAALATAVRKPRCTRFGWRGGHGTDKIIKFEGGYHGLHDAALVSVKPHPPADDFGDIKDPNRCRVGGRAEGEHCQRADCYVQ